MASWRQKSIFVKSYILSEMWFIQAGISRALDNVEEEVDEDEKG